MERLLTTREVAALLSVSKRTVQRLTAEGRLPPPVYVGQIPRWRASELSSFIESLPRRPVSPMQ